MKRKLEDVLKLLIGIAIVSSLLYMTYMSPIKDLVTVENISSLVNSFGMWGPLIYMILYILLIIFFVPASLLTIAGGLLFGIVWGTFYVVVAATIAACIGFLISRQFSDRFNFVSSYKWTKAIVNKCEKQCKENGLQTFIILRLMFIHYMGLSYAAGLVRTAKLKDFALATFLTNIIGSFSFVYFGSQLDAGWKALILPVVLILLTLLIPKIVKKYQKNGLQKIVDKE